MGTTAGTVPPTMPASHCSRGGNRKQLGGDEGMRGQEQDGETTMMRNTTMGQGPEDQEEAEDDDNEEEGMREQRWDERRDDSKDRTSTRG